MTPPLGAPRNVIRSCFAFFWLICCVLGVAGCHTRRQIQVDDPALKPIAEMLQAKVPLGATESFVYQFLALRGYTMEPVKKPNTVVALIRHVDPEKLEPVTARVTFYFNSNGKLDTYEISRTLNQPVPR